MDVTPEQMNKRIDSVVSAGLPGLEAGQKFGRWIDVGYWEKLL